MSAVVSKKSRLSLLSLPDELLDLIASHFSAEQHILFHCTCKRTRKLYSTDEKWSKLLRKYFAEFYHKIESSSGGHGWKNLFLQASGISRGLEQGKFSLVNECHYDVSGPGALHQTKLVSFPDGSVYILEKRVQFATSRSSNTHNDVVQFSFRSVESGKEVFAYVPPLDTLFKDFDPIFNRTHCDLCIENGFVFLVYHRPNFGFRRLYATVAPQSVSELALCLHSLTQSELFLAASFDHSVDADGSATTQPKIVHYEPPFVALAGERFTLLKLIARRDCGVEKNISICMESNLVFEMALDGVRVLSSKWDSEFCVLACEVQTSVGVIHEFRVFDIVRAGKLVCIVPSQFPIAGHYLDFFRDQTLVDQVCSDVKTCGRFLLLASTDEKLGAVCPHCPLYNVFCLESTQNGDKQQYKFPSCSHGLDPVDDEFDDGDHRFFEPHGIFFGGKGPFVACSNGSDVYWYPFGSEDGSRVRPRRMSNGTLQVYLSQASQARTGAQGTKKVFFFGHRVCIIWTDLVSKKRTVSLFRPVP
uniref:F-box domain-containing protein n=1 Tax=Palpitomonas bilix TaxID=652834 RepID=A0A7S3G6F6_9EUKA|mmetsp:Transcript_23193/g.58785  ORF Transcript_23193/g.58785 Transcript_23193/m.58785 type:complete len:531 (+) Transcript_23193:162-1754(+)